MNWFEVGYDAGDKFVQQNSQRRSFKNVWFKPEERGVIRILDSQPIVFKRWWVARAVGQKMITSPGTPEADALFRRATGNDRPQIAYAWKVIDRRIVEFQDKETGEARTKGPSVGYLAEGRKTAKLLEALQNELLEEERENRNNPNLSLSDFNITHYDLSVTKLPDKGGFSFRPKSAQELSQEDLELVEKYDFDLREELKPPTMDELKVILGSQSNGAPQEEPVAAPVYSYDDEDEDTINFGD